MAIDGLNGELLADAADSGEPIRLERMPFVIEVFVRRMESFEMEQVLAELAAERDLKSHPLATPSRHGRKVPTR